MADRNKVLGTKTSISDRKFLRKSSNLHSSGFLYYDVSFQSCFYHKKRYRQSHRGENEKICQRMPLSNEPGNVDKQSKKISLSISFFHRGKRIPMGADFSCSNKNALTNPKQPNL